jgi:hypothetical protein
VTDTTRLAPFDERLDRLVNLDLGGRGVEHLYEAARQRQKRPLVAAAADSFAAIEPGATVVLTTGSVSRAWISPYIGENDGPAGLAAIARALWLARKPNLIILVEETLLGALGSIMTAAGLAVLTADQTAAASRDGSLAAVTLQPFTTNSAQAPEHAAKLLDELKPALLFSTERVGRNRDGIYCSMRGLDFGMERARIDFVFDEAFRRGIPTVAVGDGGNEIGMGVIAEAVREHVKFGDTRPTGGAGIGATTAADVLVTAAVSNWGCYAIVAALAARLKDARLIHSPSMEAKLLNRGVDIGLINSVDGIVDANVDGIPLSSHLAVAELLSAIVGRCTS